MAKAVHVTGEIKTNGIKIVGKIKKDKTFEPIKSESQTMGVATGTANMIKCAGITEKDKVVIITDRPTLKVGEGIKTAAEATGAKVEFIMMEDLGQRPLTYLPDITREKIKAMEPTVSFLAVTTQEGELGFRKPIIGLLVGEFNVRHVHMPHMTEAVAGGQAMCADYNEVYRITHQVLEIVKTAKEIRVTTKMGTDLTAKFDHTGKELRWMAADGDLTKQGTFSNLPDGEVFTTPLIVNGKFVTTLLGDHFSSKYGVLKNPVTIEIKDGRAVSVSCKDSALQRELADYLNKGENTDRVGEFAIGTNTAITYFIGNMLADEKAAGVHIAFGDPIGDETGAKWKPNERWCFHAIAPFFLLLCP
ncbi:MAG: aminopeptidase [Candidatus Micrarchaeota archaeon]|nr:aminopeptidase [Candidatus Micrarchaeota archaeon]